MHKLLVPIDGSEVSLRAVDHLLVMRDWYRLPLDVHLINVQHVLHKDVAQFVSAEDAKGYYEDESRKELAAACTRLDAAGVKHERHVVVGEQVPETIVHFAREHGIDQILMCTHGRSSVADMALGSVAKGVLQHTNLPVTLVR